MENLRIEEWFNYLNLPPNWWISPKNCSISILSEEGLWVEERNWEVTGGGNGGGLGVDIQGDWGRGMLGEGVSTIITSDSAWLSSVWFLMRNNIFIASHIHQIKIKSAEASNCNS